MIDKVILKNWKSHLNSELSFTRGTNVLIGHLGSGKTSVLDGICFALFGKTPTLQSKKIKLDEMIMSKPVMKDKAEVEVYFSFDGKKYSVKRVIERGKGTTYSEIRENGKLLEAPNSEMVTELVEKILKVNFELFSKAIYSEQNSLDYFLTLPKGERMKRIDKLLMIDKFEVARSNAVTLKNRIIDRKESIQTFVDELEKQNLEKSLEELKKSLEDLKKRKDKIETGLKLVLERKNKLEREVNELKEKKKQMEELKKESVRIESVIEEISTAIEELERRVGGKSINEIKSEYEDANRGIKEKEGELIQKKKEIEGLELPVSKLRGEISKIDEIMGELKVKIEEKDRIKEKLEKIKREVGQNYEEVLEQKRKELENLVGKINGLKINLENLKENLDKLSESKGRCPVCDADLSEEKRRELIEKRKDEVERIQEEISKMEKIKDELNAKKSELERRVNEIKELEKEISDLKELKSKLEECEKNLPKKTEELKKFEERLSNLRASLEEMEDEVRFGRDRLKNLEFLLSQAIELEEKRKRLEENLKMAKQINFELEGLEKLIKEKDLDRMESELVELIGDIKEKSAEVSGLADLIRERESRINEYEEKIRSLEKQREEIRKLEKLIKELDIFEKSLKKTQNELREYFVELVNYGMNKIWSTLYPYQDFIGINLKIEGGDYVLQLEERSGNFVNVEGRVSGGERSIACLALRVAISLTLAPQLKLLVLDEPTENLDRKAIEDFTRTLREKIGEIVDQVFIISHNPEIENAITGKAYRLERDKSRDEPTRVVPL